MHRAARPSRPDPRSAGTPRCAVCDHPFSWSQARVDPGTVRRGAAPRAPEVHCPHCDALVAQWHLDLVSDHAGWGWSPGQAPANHGVELPSDPPHRWGGGVPTQRDASSSPANEGTGVP